MAWSAEPIALYEDERVSVNAKDASVTEVLEAIANVMPLTVYSAQPLDRRISFAVNDQRVEQVIRRLLRQHSYTLRYSVVSEQFEVWIHPGDTDPVDRIVIGADNRSDHGLGEDAARWNKATIDLLAADVDTRIDALFALADVDADAATDLYRVALGDAERSVRAAATELLSEAGAVSVLTESWWTVPATEQILIVDALGDIDTPQSSAFLGVISNSGNAELAAAAEQYLTERRDRISNADPSNTSDKQGI